MKKKNKGRTLIAVFIALLIGGLCAWYFLFGGDELKGTWNYDDITMYQFNGRGKGTLVLPENSYEFSYELTEEEVHMDFANEQIEDSSYYYSVEEDTLTLFGAVGKEEFSYEMQKVK